MSPGLWRIHSRLLFQDVRHAQARFPCSWDRNAESFIVSCIRHWRSGTSLDWDVRHGSATRQDFAQLNNFGVGLADVIRIVPKERSRARINSSRCHGGFLRVFDRVVTGLSRASDFLTISNPKSRRMRKQREPSPPLKSPGVSVRPAIRRAANPTIAFGGYFRWLWTRS